MIHRLFVYGSLAPGEPNEHLLAGIEGSWREACVRGHLRDVGWGARMGFPAITLDPTGDPVRGLLFESLELPGLWQELDAFEGDEYRRVRTEVETAGGVRVEAFVYVARDPSNEAADNT